MQVAISSTEIGSILDITPQGLAQYIRGLELDKEKEEFFGGKTRYLTHAGARKLFTARGFKYPKKNICFYANKGGVGKTTLAINMAYRAAQLGARVLLFDLDMQANATNTFISHIPKHVFYDVITKNTTVDKVIIPLDNGLDILPSSLTNTRLELELITKQFNQESYFKSILEPIRDNYDLVIIDLAPSLSHASYLAVLASDLVYIPATPDIYSAQGIDITWGTIQDIEKNFPNKKFEVNVVWNKYNSKETNSLKFITDMKKYEGMGIAPVIIRVDAALKNAQAEGKTTFEFKSKGNSLEDIDVLTKDMLGIDSFFNKKANA